MGIKNFSQKCHDIITTLTLTGERFILNHVKGEKETALIYCTESQLKALVHSEVWYCDGSF